MVDESFSLSMISRASYLFHNSGTIVDSLSTFGYQKSLLKAGEWIAARKCNYFKEI